MTSVSCISCYFPTILLVGFICLTLFILYLITKPKDSSLKHKDKSQKHT